MIVRVTKATFRDHSVRAGYEYDDETNEITGYWCENDTGLPMTMRIHDSADSKQIDTLEFKSGEKVEVGKQEELEEKDGTKVPPFTMEMAYAWRAIK